MVIRPAITRASPTRPAPRIPVTVVENHQQGGQVQRQLLQDFRREADRPREVADHAFGDDGPPVAGDPPANQDTVSLEQPMGDEDGSACRD